MWRGAEERDREADGARAWEAGDGFDAGVEVVVAAAASSWLGVNRRGVGPEEGADEG